MAMSLLDPGQIIKMVYDSANEAIQVNLVAGTINVQSDHQDGSAFTTNTDYVSAMAAIFDDVAPSSVDEGDVGALRMSANRNLYTQIRDAAGNERGVNVTAANALEVDGSGVTQPISAASLPLPTGAATEAKQDNAITELQAIKTSVELIDNTVSGNELQVDVVASLPAGTNAIGKLAANDGVDIGDVTINNASLAVTQSGTWNINNVSGTVSLPTGAATESTIAARLSGSFVPAAYDYTAITYVTVGNGIGEIETVTYKTGGAGGTTVKTLTLTYDANDKLASVTAS